MNKTLKLWLMIIGAVILLIAAVQIGIKLFKAGEKVKETVFDVGAVSAADVQINEAVTIQGIVEGDPQVKVYPQVPGKFVRNAVTDGAFVKRDEVLSYIDRDMVGFDYQLAPVKSPIEGIVTKLYMADKGAGVSPMYPIAEVANPDKIKVVLATGEEELVKISKGQKAVFTGVYSSVKLDGSVFSVTPYVDKDTMAGTIIVKADNKERKLKPGESVNIEITIGTRKGIMIDENAVLMGEGKTYIFVNDNGAARRVDVELGYTGAGMSEIKGGIKQGEEIITTGGFKLYEGAKVNVKK